MEIQHGKSHFYVVISVKSVGDECHFIIRILFLKLRLFFQAQRFGQCAKKTFPNGSKSGKDAFY